MDGPPRLRDVHLKLNPSKCCFGTQSITFLGHLVSVERSHPNLKKIVVVENFPIPKSITNVSTFLGPINYYRKFVPNYAKIVEALFGLIKKDNKFVWRPIC